MHPIIFGMKRMFLRSLAFTREYTNEHHLTPARFDMLVAIRRGGLGIVQRSVRYQLGVRSPTVSRMMASLEKLGYIRRFKYPPDRRHRWVALTEMGRLVIDAAQGDLTFGPMGEDVARKMVSDQPELRIPTDKALAATCLLFGTIRRRLSDSASLRYPSYLASGERMPDHPVPYPGEYASWMGPRTAPA